MKLTKHMIRFLCRVASTHNGAFSRNTSTVRALEDRKLILGFVPHSDKKKDTRWVMRKFVLTKEGHDIMKKVLRELANGNHIQAGLNLK